MKTNLKFHDDLRMHFKARLNAELSERGRATEVANESGIPKQSISTWKNLELTAIPDIVDGARLAAALQTTVESLVFGSGPENFEQDELLILAKKHRKLLSDFDSIDAEGQGFISEMIGLKASVMREEAKKRLS